MKEKIIMLAEDTETTINYSKYHIGDWAEVYTTDKIIMKRYEKFMKAHPDLCKLIREDIYSMTFSVDPYSAGIYPKAKRKGAPLTDEQKEQRMQNLAKARKNNDA